MRTPHCHTVYLPVLSRLVLIATLPMLCSSALLEGSSSPPGRLLERTYYSTAAKANLPYVLYVPLSLRANQAAPLVVALHGLNDQPIFIMKYPNLTSLAERYGFIVVAPLGYSTRGWYGLPIPVSRRVAGDPRNLSSLSELDVMSVVAFVSSSQPVDRRHVFILGHSMGGGGAWHLALKYPTKWAGIAAIAPAPVLLRSREDVSKIRHVPVIIVQGLADDKIPVTGARQWVGLLKSVGVQHEYLEVKDGTHVSAAHKGLPAIFRFFHGLCAKNYTPAPRYQPRQRWQHTASNRST